MSAVSSVKLKANCNAVSSGSFINQSVVNSSTVEKSSLNNIKTSASFNNNIIINNGTNLSQSSINCKPVNESAVSSYHHHHQYTQDQQESISDVQKVLKQEQELQKQLYSGSNNAPGWLRVNHNNKVIYIR